MLTAAEGYLRERSIEAPRLSVEWMLARVLSLSRLQVYLAHDRPVTEHEKQRLREMVARRGVGEPLAYILGDQEFCGHLLKVTRDVSIPRPETEHLVELVTDSVPEGARGVDLGTGSGAIAVAVCCARKDVSMVATDVSEAAVDVARHNAKTLGVAERVEFRVGSWWEPLAGVEAFDFLVSNPPYVDPERPELLAKDVAAFEPHVALFDRPGSAYAALVDGMRDGLKPGARVFLETGVGADAAAVAELRGSDFLADVSLLDDEAGLPRYLLARKV